MDKVKQTEVEAAVFRKLVSFLQEHHEVQNIDLMITAGFCRNCLSKWYLEATEQADLKVEYADAQRAIFGMPYADWKTKYQKEATPEQMKAYEDAQKKREALQQQ